MFFSGVLETVKKFIFYHSIVLGFGFFPFIFIKMIEISKIKRNIMNYKNVL